MTKSEQDWIGFVQPVGLLVSPAALNAAQAVPDRNVIAAQEVLAALVHDAVLADFPRMTRDVLGWEEPDPDKHFFDDMKKDRTPDSSVPDPNVCD